MSKKDTLTALMFAFLCALSIVVQKVALEELKPIEVSFLRVFLLSIFSVFFLKKRPKIIPLILIGFFAYILNTFFLGLAIKSGAKIVISSVLVQTNAVFGTLFTYLLLKERISSKFVVGMAITAIGVFVLLSSKKGVFTFDPGILYLLVSSSCWGLGVTLMKKFDIGRKVEDIYWLSVVSAVSMAPLFFLNEGGLDVTTLVNISLKSLLSIATAAYCSTLLATILLIRLTKKYKSQAVFPFLLFIPVFSGGMAFIFWGEAISLQQSIASVFILFGVITSQLKGNSIKGFFRTFGEN